MKLKIKKNIINKKNILITGNTGFVGSWLSLTLHIFGANILGFSLKKKNKSFLSNLLLFKKNIKTIYADINLINKYKNRLKKFKPEIAIHLASQPLVLDSYLDTKKTFLTNVMGTVNFLETMKNLRTLKKIIIFTSDKVYRNLKGSVLNENSPLGGIDPYSASKSCQDIISTSYKSAIYKKNIEIIILRAGNIIGGGDWNEYRLVPDIFKSIHNKKKVYIRNPNAIRPWQHILEIINVFILIIIKKKSKISHKPDIYNIAPSIKSNLRVIDLIKLIKNVETNNKFNFSIKKNSKYESKILKLSSLNAKKKINYKPILNLKKSIQLTSDWYNSYYKRKNLNMFDFTINQIKNFFNAT